MILPKMISRLGFLKGGWSGLTSSGGSKELRVQSLYVLAFVFRLLEGLIEKAGQKL